ncbi:MAG: DUF3299 domain-containing protein [Hydrogenophaga sp.]|uniref:DUF3299 domain-containing protein n=1 Tax=Hydrogenophaga sp. TaxID=1904254 RepID=UPI0025B899C1|nr:DUF3299 domain-containing protein [Hydrogenophaga sp.]MBU7575571.1 DUF3299 domain-containing protein [Hydrogenophaga sp.]
MRHLFQASRFAALFVMGGAALVGAGAQTLGSPVPPGTTSSQPSGLPHGQGAGVHSPLSPFAPLPKRSDVVAWSMLTDITTKVENKRIVPVYPAPVAELNQKKLRLQGFMMPLEPGESQRHFLLASVPLTCGFCTPGGPESMVEVRTSKPVKYKLEAVVVEGTFHVLQNDPYGLYYRITGAVGVE